MLRARGERVRGTYHVLLYVSLGMWCVVWKNFLYVVLDAARYRYQTDNDSSHWLPIEHQ